MLAYLQNLLELSTSELLVSLLVVLLAGLVRGFAGFGLSALVMAALAVLISPVMLIPVCYLLEAVASGVMLRGGFKDADHHIAWGLAIGSAVGMPLGLLATVTVSPDTSRAIALSVILVLAIAQLSRSSPAFLSTRPGLYLAGLLAGIATGLASVGGMVVALYVLAQQVPAKKMRASLVMFLFLGMFTSGIILFASGLLDSLALRRGLVFAPAVVTGVLLGTHLFRPSLQPFYRRFCLLLLMLLAASGLVRLVIQG